MPRLIIFFISVPKIRPKSNKWRVVSGIEILALVLSVAFSVLSGSDNLCMTRLNILVLLLKWTAYGLSNLQVSIHWGKRFPRFDFDTKDMDFRWVKWGKTLRSYANSTLAWYRLSSSGKSLEVKFSWILSFT